MRVDLPGHSLDGISGYFLQLRHNIFDNVEFGILRVQVLLEVNVRELVSCFELAIVITLFLDRIVCQVDKSIGDILQVEVFAARSEIPFVVPVTLQIPINAGQKSVAPDVELPALVEQRLFYVLLYYVGSLLPIDCGVAHDIFYLLDFSAHINSTASVRVLSRLYNPHRLTHLFEDLAVLTRVVAFEEFSKFGELFVVDSFLDVEGQRQHLKPFLSNGFVVNLHVVVNCLLVA